MRIGIVLSALPQYSETFLNNKIKALQDSGFDVTVFTAYTPAQKTFYRYIRPYPRVRNKILQAPAAALVILVLLVKAPQALLRFWQAERAAGVPWAQLIKSIYGYAHIMQRKVDWLDYGFATLCLGRESLAWAMGAKMSVSIRGYDMTIYPLKHRNCFDRMWQFVDKLHTISDDLLVRARENGMPANLPFVKITPAIDVSMFLTKAHPGKVNLPVRLLSVGRLTWKKGFDYALFALRLLKENNIVFRYEIVGAGPELPQLKYIVHSLGLTDSVAFTGKLTPRQVVQKMSDADIYLQPSVQEGFCNSVLEAQLAGIVCIVSDAGGLPENVINGTTGWVVPRRNPEALAAAIIKVLAIPEEDRRALALRAARRVREQFNIEKQKEEFVRFFSNAQ